MMSTFYFVGGASGSGKTAIMHVLKKSLGNSIAVYDFDDIGVPENADKKWRQESTEKWLQKLLDNNKDACLLGQIVLGEILACPSAKSIKKINFCLLDVNDFERIRRLKSRNTYGADQTMLNWSSWLRMHHQDPQWMQHVLKEDCWGDLDFTVWDQDINWDDKAVLNYMDTTQHSITEVAELVAEWMNKNNQRSTGLSNIFTSDNKEARFIDDRIVDFNKIKVPFSQDNPFEYLNFHIKDSNGMIIAGINAVLYCWGMLHIDTLYVDEQYRGQQLGGRLLHKVENDAKSMGATLAHLDTFDWQAKGFYLKQGYEVFAILDECPKDHKRYYLKKSLNDKGLAHESKNSNH